MSAEARDTYTPPAHGWTCFHCGETFHVEVQARGHFGSDVDGEPMCVMRANAFARFPRTEWPLMYRMRELEAEVGQLRADAWDEHCKTFYARLESEIRGTAGVFKDCRTLRDVFNLYDSMEGRAIAAEERLSQCCQKLDDALAALAVIAEMGDKTLIHDPAESEEVRRAYSLGAHRAFAQAAAVAKTVLPREHAGK